MENKKWKFSKSYFLDAISLNSLLPFSWQEYWSGFHILYAHSKYMYVFFINGVLSCINILEVTFLVFLAVPHSLQDLSSPTRYPTLAVGSESSKS